ncbi:flavodoxin family protein [Candidatus Methanoprimaticola sp. MG2]|uniref:flavodoxin family protein n=1 Tax=Candidatus Methanoprimaticola sp. MG2 TaxID=3228838 RepID=UPI0039C6EE36
MGEIVAIVTSPHPEGNSASIVDAITDGAMGLSTNLIQLYTLGKSKFIHCCNECGKCKQTGFCAIEDDMSEVLNAIRTADCVIFSTAVHFNNVSAQYKILEDRMYSFLNSDLSINIKTGKKAIVVVTAAASLENAKVIASHMAASLTMMGFEVIDRVVFSSDMGTKKASEDPDILLKAKQAGMKLRNTPTV